MTEPTLWRKATSRELYDLLELPENIESQLEELTNRELCSTYIEARIIPKYADRYFCLQSLGRNVLLKKNEYHYTGAELWKKR